MHLRLNNSDIQTLVEMVCLAVQSASWNNQDNEGPDFERFIEMEQRILRRAAEAGFGDWFEFDEEAGRLVLSDEFREASYARRCVDELRNTLFWDELMYRLAERDVIRQISFKSWNELDDDRRNELTKPLEERYWKEFRQNGIENFHLIHGLNQG